MNRELYFSQKHTEMKDICFVERMNVSGRALMI